MLEIMKKEIKMTIKEAYMAMQYFLEQFYDRTGSDDVGIQEINTAAELVQRSVDPEANIIFGTAVDENWGDELVITVIATGFDKERMASNLGVEQIVAKAWDKKITSVPTSVESTSSNSQDLDIPSFLRKNKGAK